MILYELTACKDGAIETVATNGYNLANTDSNGIVDMVLPSYGGITGKYAPQAFNEGDFVIYRGEESRVDRVTSVEGDEAPVRDTLDDMLTRLYEVGDAPQEPFSVVPVIPPEAAISRIQGE